MDIYWVLLQLVNEYQVESNYHNFELEMLMIIRIVESASLSTYMD